MLREVLEKELAQLKKELKAFHKLNDTPYLSYAVKSLSKSNIALSRYVKTKDENAYKWAQLWDRARKYFAKQAEKQNITDYGDRRITLEARIAEIQNTIYRGRK